LGPEKTTSEANAIWAQTNRDFQGPPLPMSLEMDLPQSKSLRPAPYKQTTGTLIVITDSQKIGLLLVNAAKDPALNLHFFLDREQAVGMKWSRYHLTLESL
jgi:hypothetical protein